MAFLKISLTLLLLLTVVINTIQTNISGEVEDHVATAAMQEALFIEYY